MQSDGFPFRRMIAKGQFAGGQFRLEEGFFDSSAARLAANGHIDLLGPNSRLTVLLAPLTTVERVVGAIPLLGDLFDIVSRSNSANLAIFRRHALLEWLLTSVVGLGWAESDEEAMRLQVAISPRVEARLDEMLGHPEICPHGNPIDAATAKRRPRGIRLSEMEAGTNGTVYRITEEAEEDAGLLSYLEARALKPGAPVTILARSESLDSLTLDGPRGRATLGLRPAALIRVLPGEADPSLFHTVPER